MGCGSSKSGVVISSSAIHLPNESEVKLKSEPQPTSEPEISEDSRTGSDSQLPRNNYTPVSIPSIHITPVPTMEVSDDVSSEAAYGRSESKESTNTQQSVTDAAYGRSVSKESTITQQSITEEPMRKHIAYKITKEETGDVLDKLEQCFRRLHETIDYESYESHKDLEYIRCTSRLPLKVDRFGKDDRRPIFVDKMVECNVTDLFIKVWKHCFHSAFVDGDSNCYFALQNILITLWNSTDYHVKLCHQIVDAELHLKCLQYLDDPILYTDQNNEKDYMIKGLIGISTNLLQKIAFVRHHLRKHNVVNILQRYKDSENIMLQCKVAIALAYLMDEHENEIINADDKNIVFMIKILKSTLQQKDHVSRTYGYKAEELIHALNLLSSNENNKARIVDNGGLPYYVQLMAMDGSASEREQELAAEGVWSLAFKCTEELQREPGLVQALETLVADSPNRNVQTQAKGALWILHGRNITQPGSQAKTEQKNKRTNAVVEEEEDADNSDESEEDEEDDDTPHIMISYQWGVQTKMLEVRDRLKEAGYKVWMDVDEMSGSILEAMALAVEKSAVVIVCMSQKYKESPNCRTEAEYAYRQHKMIIPLRLEYRYNADGWLGALVGNRLYFDFSVDERFEGSMAKLIKELGPQGKRKGGGHVKTGPAIQPPAIQPTVTHPQKTQPQKVQPAPSKPDKSSKTVVPNTPGGDGKIKSASIVTEADVEKWFDKNGLGKEKNKFSGFDGPLLTELNDMLKNAPEFFYTHMKEEMRMPLLSILKFTKALKQL